MKTAEKTECDYREAEHRAWHRLREFAGPIQDLANVNPMIHRIVHNYAAGHIITREEALCQMVIHLAANWKETNAQYIDLLMRTTAPMIKPNAF